MMNEGMSGGNVDRLIRALEQHVPPKGLPPSEHRERYEYAASTRQLPRNVQICPLADHSIDGELVITASRRLLDNQYVILYFHGGGFISGSPRTARPITTRLSHHTGTTVVVPKYRLAPENPYPVALEDAYTSYRWLLEEGFRPEEIIVAGDSAGAGLAANVCLRAGDDGSPVLGFVGLSGWYDLSLSSPSLCHNRHRDPQAPEWLLNEMASYYLAGIHPETPDASPLFGNLKNLPPTLLQVGAHETLLDDSRRLHDCAKQCGRAVDLQIWDGMIHVWHQFAPRLNEAMRALEYVARWIAKLQPRVDGN
jgi:epsilon-lactone hydrolase